MASRSLWRDLLTTELRYFESEYDALMYGGVPITQASLAGTARGSGRLGASAGVCSLAVASPA